MATAKTIDLITGKERLVKSRTRERSLDSLDSAADKRSRKAAQFLLDEMRAKRKELIERVVPETLTSNEKQLLKEKREEYKLLAKKIDEAVIMDKKPRVHNLRRKRNIIAREIEALVKKHT